MTSSITVPFKKNYAYPTMCCLCGQPAATHNKTITLRQGFSGGRQITLLGKMPICDACQKKVSTSMNINTRAILMGFLGFVLAWVVIFALGAIFRAIGLGDAGVTIGMIIGLACMIGFPIFLVRPVLAQKTPEVVTARKQYESVRSTMVSASSWEADVVLEVPSAAFASIFADLNGGTVQEKP
jgi:hypothetical protein